jgi:hypothetical protein
MRARRHTPLILATLLTAVACAIGAPAAAATPQPSSGTAPSSGTTSQPESAAFPTPEAAVREYLAGVAAADAGRILGASAIDEMAAGFRFDLFTDRLRAFTLHSMAPADHPFYVQVNRAQQTAEILRQAEMLTYSLLSDVEIDGSTIAPADKAWAEGFARQVDPSRLSDLTVVDVRFPDASLENNTRWLDNAALQAAAYGADELTERLVLFDLDGKLYDVGFQLLRYGDTWKVASQNSNLAGTTVLGTARPATLEEYQLETSGEG